MGSARILVIDDDEKSRRLAQVVLESRDYTVMMAGDGQEGLEQAIREGPDLIVLDVMMPMMDGFETCERLKRDERTRKIPVIMLTATYDLELNKKAFRRGAAMCVTKPYRGEALVSAIEAVLASRRRRSREPG